MTFRKSGRVKGLKAWCAGIVAVPLVILGLSAPASAGASAPVAGQVDSSFKPPGVDAAVNAVAVQPDGKILIGGGFTTITPADSSPVTRKRLARLNADGSLDTSFNLGIDPDPGQSVVQSVALQPDGKILVAARLVFIPGPGLLEITRLNSNGTRDETFNPPTIDLPVISVAVQPDGKILIGGGFTTITPAGSSSVTRKRVARLNSTGTFDESFGDPNVKGVGSAPLNGDVYSVVPGPGGKVLIGGQFTSVGSSDTPMQGVARLNSNGSLDGTFANPRVTSTALVVQSVVVQPNGDVLIGGGFNCVGADPSPSCPVEDFRVGVARLRADGILDIGFSNPNVNSGTSEVLLQDDGRILIGGPFSQVGAEPRSQLARLDDEGKLDNTFVDPAIGGADAAVNSLALQPDGKVVTGGRADGGGRVRRVFSTSPQAAPTAVSATAGNGQATVSWTAVPGEITEYTATANSDSHSCDTTSETSCTVTGLTNGTSYTFTVKAANEFGDGPASSPSNAVTPLGPPTELTVTRSGTGSGTVTSTPAGIDCGSACSGSFAQSTSVTLTATAASGSTFTEWSGSGCSGTGTCAVTMSEARSVTATFTADPPTPDPPGPTPDPPGPTPSPSASVSGVKAKVTKKAVSVTSRVKVSGAGKVAQRATTGKGSKARTWCRASRNVSAAGTHTLKCNLGKKGRKALRKGTLRLTLRTTFTPTTGKAVTSDRNLTLKRKR